MRLTPYLIADQRHPPIMRPREMSNRRTSVVDKLDTPSPFELDPDEDDSGAVA